MPRLRAAVLLLLCAALLPTPAGAGTADDPELTDPAGDQAVDQAFPPDLPLLSDDDFADIDILGAAFGGGRAIDCLGEDPADCPAISVLLLTSEGWHANGQATITFTVERGPTSYADSTAAGQTVMLALAGTTVTGLPNATASSQADGLVVSFGMGRAGITGGDVLGNLTVTTQRTDAGLLTDPSATQDDAMGSDAAGPATRSWTVPRDPVVAGVEARVSAIAGRAGNALPNATAGPHDVQVAVTNQGTDRDGFTLRVASSPVLPGLGALARNGTLDRGASAEFTLPVSLAQAPAGATVRVWFNVTTERGANDSAVAVFTLSAGPRAAREVVPAGLAFLTPAATAVALDDALGKYAELAFLALLVLVVVLVLFLLVALAPARLAGAPVDAAPQLAELPAPPARKPRTRPSAAAAEDGPGVPPAPARGPPPALLDDVAPAAAPSTNGALAIAAVRHDPAEPEEGGRVATEVVIDNPGPARKVRVVLAQDDADVDETAAELAPSGRTSVRLSWTAGPGENRVKVRVLPA